MTSVRVLRGVPLAAEVLLSAVSDLEDIAVVNAADVASIFKFAERAEDGASAGRVFVFLQLVVDGARCNCKRGIIEQFQDRVGGFVHPPTPPAPGRHLLGTLAATPKFQRLVGLEAL